MSGRHNQSATRAALLAGAGVTGLAALLVTPPVAHAAPAPASDNADPGAKTTDSSSKKAQADVTPQYGYQKYRVGVQGKNGDYFPPGTSTVGTKFHVVKTNADGTPRASFDCESVDNQSADPHDSTFCRGDYSRFDDVRRKVESVNVPTPDDVDLVFTAEPGVTVTVTQTTVKNNLLIDSSTATLKPCELDSNDLFELCGTTNSETGFDATPTATDLVFVDPGLPPLASDDSASTKEGVPVTIKIAPNDDPRGPIKGVKIVNDPSDGTAKLVTEEDADPSSSSATSTAPAPGTSTVTEMLRRSAGSRSLAAVTSYLAVYTPNAGFVGVDSFKYTITTQNGTATATVRVTVTGTSASTSASASASESASTSGRDPIAETGTQSGTLVGYAAALLATGGGALALGRQRRRGRHAG